MNTSIRPELSTVKRAPQPESRAPQIMRVNLRRLARSDLCLTSVLERRRRRFCTIHLFGLGSVGVQARAVRAGNAEAATRQRRSCNWQPISPRPRDLLGSLVPSHSEEGHRRSMSPPSVIEDRVRGRSTFAFLVARARGRFQSDKRRVGAAHDDTRD